MSDETLPNPAPLRFRARLTPHRSLTPAGFLAVMSALAAASFAAGLIFLLAGAWPVVGFLGLDVVLVYLAFRLNYRSARQYEIVELTDAALTVTRVDARGRGESFGFNPYWVQLDVRERSDGRADLRLGSHGREISFGRFLSDTEKRDFARALTSALLAARTRRA